MSAGKPELRAARPSLEDGRAFAGYLDQAAEGFFRLWLGGRSVDILASAYLESAHDLSFENVTFAERDGFAVGMVSGYTSEQHSRSSEQPLSKAAGGWSVRMAFVGLLFAPILRVLGEVGEGDFYLQAIAVDGEARGQGVGSVLMDAIEKRARDAGSVRLALDVAAKNKGARRLYERRGWTVESRWPRRWFVPGPRLIRMVKVL